MNIAIYQIDPDRDENNVAFLNYENLERFQGSAALRSEIYDKVFEGEVECGTLEEVYQMFNIGQPDGYRGRSLSVSDVVEVVGEEKSTFHFCDSIGFAEKFATTKSSIYRRRDHALRKLKSILGNA